MSRVAVVTGGMGGLGEAICMKLGKMDYKVVATYSPGNTKHNEWLAEMKKQGYEFRAVPVDVTNFESCQQAIAQITKDVGPVDVLVKAGMHGFTKAAALEYAKKGVTVNTISPGYIGTKMVMAIPKEVLDSKIIPQIPVGRLGKPEEVAGLVAYLCSEEAAFVTGANIAINGGQHMQ